MRKMVTVLGLLGLTVLSLSSCLSQPAPPPTSRATHPAPCSLGPALRAAVTTRPPTGHIVYSSDGDIYVMQADGSHRKQLTSDPWPQFDPNWSPDGKHIAYRDGRNGHNEIYVMNSDGSGKLNLTNHTSDSWSPAWSPNGRTIAFASDREGVLSIYTMHPDGSGVRRLTSEWGEYPTWSPDSRQIAFAAHRDGNYEIYVMNADGSNQRRLTTNPAYDMAPAWSPNGRYLAFDTQRDHLPPAEVGIGPEFEIHVMRTDGTCDTRLTSNLVEDRFPAWSPDGSRVAWSEQGHILLMNSDGSNPIDLGPGSFPDWGR
jgi:tol-pal system beta propeller repeat protein TolB